MSYEAILTAAAQIIERGGVAALTTNAVAERAGVSIGTLYQYFPNKDALCAELVRRLKQEFVDDMSGAVEQAMLCDDIAEAARIVLSASIRHHASNPGLTRELEMLEQTMVRVVDEGPIRAEIVGRLALLLERFGHPDPRVGARDLSALSKGLVHAALFDGETDLDAIGDRLRPAVFGYLGIRD